MKRILINAVQKEEIRVAMVDGQKLYDLDVEIPSNQQKKGNVYKGKITRVEPSLEAAFVDYGGNRHGFLSFKEISRSYFTEEALQGGGRADIKTAIKEGQEIIVQVEKEERGNKGAALTSFISLAGRFLVLMPNNPRAGGVSRRIEGEDRKLIRESLSHLEVPNGMGLIVRTAGVGRNTEELQWDLDYLMQVWSAIEKATVDKPAPFLVYQESDIIVRTLRDNFRADINEVLTDSKEVFESAKQFIEQVMPASVRKLKMYEDSVPLFNRFQIENQIESAYRREVTLPSGGAIVIDHTEALTSIDINSARATKGRDIEDTAFHTNLEAADEIARQLRLRDLGGLVVIDFIDMMVSKNQREVENRLKNATEIDRARVQIGRLSRFGLLEMSRQRLKPSLGEATQIVCPRCTGNGTIRTVESLSLSLIRIMEEEALKDSTSQVEIQVPVSVATYMLNEKREAVSEIEKLTKVRILIIANSALETPQYLVERIRKSDMSEESTVSYLQVDLSDTPYEPGMTSEAAIQPEQAAVQMVTPAEPKPVSTAPKATSKAAPTSGGLFAWLLALFTGSKKQEKPKQQPKSSRTSGNRSQGNRSNRRPQTKQGKSRSTQNRNQSQRTKPGSTKGTKPSSNKGTKPGNAAQSNKQTPAAKAAVDKDTQKQTSADKNKANIAAVETGQSDKPSDTTEKKPRSDSSRRRGRRGGRSVRRDNEQPKNDNVQSQSNDSPQATQPVQQVKAAEKSQPASTPPVTASRPEDVTARESNPPKPEAPKAEVKEERQPLTNENRPAVPTNNKV